MNVDKTELHRDALSRIDKGDCVIVGIGAGSLGSTEAQFETLAYVQTYFQNALTVFCFDLSKYPEISDVWPTAHIPTVLLFNEGLLIHRFDGGVIADTLMGIVSDRVKSCAEATVGYII